MTEPPEIAPAALVAPVRRALASDDAEVVEWTAEPLSWEDFGAGSRTLRRVRGTARAPGSTARVRWSMVLKTFRSLQDDDRTSDDPADYAYWRREALLYESRLIDADVGGFRPARCYGVDRWSDADFVWLEDLSDLHGGRWPVERFELAARHLGRFNGWWLSRQERRAEPWLASMRSIQEHWTVNPDTQPALSALREPAGWAEIASAAGVTAPDPARLRDVMADHSGVLEALGRLPMTLCHNDAMAPNLFGARAENGADETVAIDWQLAGLAPPGTELALLVAGSAMFLRAPAGPLEVLEGRVLTAYADGLADTGARVAASEIRWAHSASTVLRMGAIVVAWIHTLSDAEGRRFAERFWRRSASELAHEWTRVLALVEGHAANTR